MAKISPEQTEETAFRNIITPQLHEALEEALGKLSEKRKNVFRLHVEEDQTFEEIGHYYSLPPERIKQIFSNAKRQLKNTTSLRQYLDQL